MANEARWMWEAFITAPENAHLLKRYAKSAKEPAPLFESIGEDLASSNQEIREIAYWALVAAMPKLTSILYGRETRQPGWRDREGKDQQMINRGTDIVTDLHREFVLKHCFKIGGKNGKDPRPYTNRIIRNREIDAQRKHEREVPLSYEASLMIPDSSRAIEDRVVEKINYEECRTEIRTLPFLKSETEFNLFETVYVDHSPLTEVLKSNDIPSEPALRQRLTRSRKQIVKERDALFSYFLILGSKFPTTGNFPRSTRFPKWTEKWAELARLSVQPGVWLNGVEADGKNAVAVRALTRSFSNAPAHIYLVAIRKKYIRKFGGRSRPRFDQMLLFYNHDWGLYDIEHFTQYIDKMINSASRDFRKSLYWYCRLDAYPTELPGLNRAVADIHGEYAIWLITNCTLDSSPTNEWMWTLDSSPTNEWIWRELGERRVCGPSSANCNFGVWGHPFWDETMESCITKQFDPITYPYEPETLPGIFQSLVCNNFGLPVFDSSSKIDHPITAFLREKSALNPME